MPCGSDGSPPCTIKTADSQELRLLLNNRRTLLEKRVAIDNEIRGTLKAFGFKIGSVGVAGFPARVTELLGEQPRLFAMVTDARCPRGAAPARRGAA